MTIDGRRRGGRRLGRSARPAARADDRRRRGDRPGRVERLEGRPDRANWCAAPRPCCTGAAAAGRAAARRASAWRWPSRAARGRVIGDDEVIVAAPDAVGVLYRTAGVLALHSLDVRSGVDPHARRHGGQHLRRRAAVRPAARRGARARRPGAGAGRRARPGGAAAGQGARLRLRGGIPAADGHWFDDAATDATVLEIRAEDSIGLLCRVTAALERSGLDVRSARVSSLGGSVVDAFYVTTRDGAPVPADGRGATSRSSCARSEASAHGRSGADRPEIGAGNLESTAARADVVPVRTLFGRRRPRFVSSHRPRQETCVSIPFSAVPAAQGLYDPQLRVRLVRRRVPRRPARAGQPRDRRAGADRAAQPRPPRRGRRRAVLRRRRRHHRPGAGRVPAGRRRLRAAGRPASTPSASRSCRPTTTPPRRPSRSSSSTAAEEGLTVLGWRDVPTDDRRPRPDRPRRDAAASGSCSSRGADGETGLALERLRLRAAQGRRAARAREPARAVLPVAVGAHAGLQGHAHHRPARRVLPRPDRRAVRQRDRPGAQPVLDQHVPVLAAGAPVPLHRAQRRVQHDPRQPQLDAHPRDAARSPT